MVDAVDSKSAVSNGVGVQVPPGVQNSTEKYFGAIFVFRGAKAWIEMIVVMREFFYRTKKSVVDTTPFLCLLDYKITCFFFCKVQVLLYR